MNKKILLSAVVMVLGVVSVVSAQSLSAREIALREQMLDFARFWPNLVSQYYPDAVKSPTSGRVLGAFPGPDVYELMNFFGGVTHGKAYATTTTTNAYTLVAGDIVGWDTILMTNNLRDITVTFPASSSLPHFLPKAGMRTTQCWQNATTTAGIDITFAAGPGIDLESASSSPTDLTVLADEFVCFEWIRKSATASAFDFGVLMREYTNGD